MTADQIIAHLGMRPHPEGGHYIQTWAAPRDADGRPAATCIHFLLRAGEVSHWHRVDATEIWFHHSGAPLILSLSETDDGPARDLILGPDLAGGQVLQGLVPPQWWQAARTTGDWTLVSCTVTPGFRFSRFTLAPPGFDIPR